ncbi:inorganic phosphate (Pi) transporter, also low-affinity manganese transporter [Rhodotorula taiwanensis]|uniref:Inorganic phosphate (Pi) transporter, also low-affinity manganese transporter n=1 Tax=Rhodotorula taiwanensis TaxID=741276 RepID=A0A2S5BI05_9BASI|nr:inorganic phosphate (Pi) transporter, also low-affinity manganese transporter [Rhodotorula taiwanensis]
MQHNDVYADGPHEIDTHQEKEAFAPTPSGSNSSMTQSNATGVDASLLNASLYPDDSYTPDGTYWADLPRGQRTKFVNKQFNEESAREARYIWDMFKRDPAAPFKAYFRKYVLTGMGLFVEGYVLFSIGNLKSIFASTWPQCWGNKPTVCDANWINAINYTQVCGIIIGQALVGVEGDWIGRKFGLCQDALIMLIGSILLTGVWSNNLNIWIIVYAWVLFVYGVGVGGEYPMTGTRAMETTAFGLEGTRDDRLHRGRNVVGSFLMQGWGQIFNQAILLICLLIFSGGQEKGRYSAKATQATYRVQFGFAVIVHFWLLYHRIFKIKDADTLVAGVKRRQNVSGYDAHSFRLLMSHFWGRLFATAGGWFANDVFFYGTKVFSGLFIKILIPGASTIVTWEWNMLNLACSLVGYYMAFIFIDHKGYGRRNMQMVGFTFDFLIYLFAGIFFHQLQKPGAPVKAFTFMYNFSSFWNQFGPNCVSFLVAAEVFPASVRGTAHGFSAAWGKAGAVIATAAFGYIDNRSKYWFAVPFGALGMFCTYFFLPDTTGLDLREQERYWRCVRAGRAEDYHGVAIHPHHLSWYERVILKRQKHYDPVQDRLDRIEELRVLYEASLIEDAYMNPEAAALDEGVVRYFRSEAPRAVAVDKQAAKMRALAENQPETEKRGVPRPSKLEDTLGL